MKKPDWKGLLAMAAAAAVFAGCAEQDNADMGTPGENEFGREESIGEAEVPGGTSVTTNVENDEIETSPGAGSAVGGDPAGAGTAPLREEDQPASQTQTPSPRP